MSLLNMYFIAVLVVAQGAWITSSSTPYLRGTITAFNNDRIVLTDRTGKLWQIPRTSVRKNHTLRKQSRIVAHLDDKLLKPLPLVLGSR